MREGGDRGGKEGEKGGEGGGGRGGRGKEGVGDTSPLSFGALVTYDISK